jgi:hypothetical protein
MILEHNEADPVDAVRVLEHNETVPVAVRVLKHTDAVLDDAGPKKSPATWLILPRSVKAKQKTCCQ